MRAFMDEYWERFRLLALEIDASGVPEDHVTAQPTRALLHEIGPVLRELRRGSWFRRVRMRRQARRLLDALEQEVKRMQVVTVEDALNPGFA